MTQLETLKQPRIVVGQKFGYLTTIGRARMQGKLCWRVRCECGREKTVQPGALVGNSRPTRSCGCKRIEALRAKQTDHGCSVKKDTAEYRTFIAWQSMLWRCYNRNRRDYPRYGGRGIKVCREWRRSFVAFLRDMGLKPADKSLGRIDNEKGYSPENCQWQTVVEQARNKCTSRFLKFKGRSITLAEWSELTGIADNTISARLKDGWPIERALSQPVRKLA